jgi:hypothetical protein
MSPIPINLALEDELTEFLASKILATIPTVYAARTIYNRGGYGYLRSKINGFNNGAKGTPFWVATDLDDSECPPALITKWLTNAKHPNLLISVAVREAEAWVLADRENFAKFLGIRIARVPENVEGLPRPKEKLIELVRGSRSRELRRDICPPSAARERLDQTTMPVLADLSLKFGILPRRDSTLAA